MAVSEYMTLSAGNKYLSFITKQQSVTQYGITWTFDEPKIVGQFVTGDYWVVGPVTIVSVSPAPTGSGTTLRNGSMVNPVVSAYQGYDGRASGYLNSLTVTYPLILSPGQSLLSSESRPEDDPPRLDLTYTLITLNRARLIGISVLTCVSSPVVSTAFRPPYAGTEKPIFDSTKLRTDLLPSLTPTIGKLSFSSIASHWVSYGQQFASLIGRPWIMHYYGGVDAGAQIHPLNNNPNYYTTCDIIEAETALLLISNPSSYLFGGTNGDILTLVRNMVQRGIDSHYTIKSYPTMPYTRRGDRCTTKWPGIFAGIMLNTPEYASESAEMLSNTYYHSAVFGKSWAKTDNMTYAGIGWNGTTALTHGDLKDDSSAPESGWYYQEISPFTDGNPWCNPTPGGTSFWKTEGYARQEGSWVWVGVALAAHKLGVGLIWNHKPFFKYCEEWMTIDESSYREALDALAEASVCIDGPNSWAYWRLDIPTSEFTENMWASYYVPSEWTVYNS